MAKGPKKSKVTSVSEDGLDEGERTILDYINIQNRPYGATDIFMNLHQSLAKGVVVKVLASLHERGLIAGKTYGKSVIYVARQDDKPAPSPEELDAIDNEITKINGQLTLQREATRLAQARVATLMSSLTCDEMRSRIEILKTETDAMEKRLKLLRSGTRSVDPEQKRLVDKQLDIYQREWRRRRRMCIEAVKSITENLPQSPSVFMEELGIEQDIVVNPST